MGYICFGASVAGLSATRSAVAVTLLVILAVTTAHAALETTSPDATLRMPAAGAADAINGEEFTVLGWFYPTAIDESEPTALFTLTNTLWIELTPEGAVSARLTSNTESADDLKAIAPVALQPNEWVLMAVSFSTEWSQLTIRVASESARPTTSVIADELFTPIAAGSEVLIGANDDHTGMIGMYGILAVRDHDINDADFAAIWDSRTHHAPYSMTTTDKGGKMTGHDGCIWMINHSMTTHPNNSGAGGSEPDRAAIVGEPVTLHNMHVLDQTGSGQSHFYRTVRKVNHTQGFVHRSPFDLPYGSFWDRTIPIFDETLPHPAFVPNIAPIARQLATGPEGLVKVIISSNSRATLPRDRSERGSANFSQGFAAIHLSESAGILNRPARLLQEPWFGMDSVDHPPYHTGSIIELDNTDFSRFWTGSGGTPRLGPGRGSILPAEATYIMRCGIGGLIEPDQPLVFRAHLLRYPGASNLSWVPNKHTQQGEPGTDVGEPTSIALDTAVYAITCGEDDIQCSSSGSTLSLTGDHTDHIQPGDACYTNGSISIVESITFDGESPGTTTLQLEKHFQNAPVPGSAVHFGPWEFLTIEHVWPGLDAEDPRIWRGMRLTAEPGGDGVAVFSFSAWRPDVDGFVFGPAGWGGHGYTRQINDSFQQPLRKWMQELAPDIWLQVFAQQGSQPSSMSNYGAIVREALPNVDLVWLGDMIHDDGKFEHWNHYILNNAESFGVPAIALAQHPLMGNMLELYADGLRMDRLHASQRGNEHMASLWTELLFQAALPEEEPTPPLGDLNNDGVVDVFDLLILVANWGECPPQDTCLADLNDDGVVDVFDLVILINNWG